MRAFVDNAGRTWTVAINVAAVKRVRALVAVDLYQLVDDGCKPLAKLLADPVKLADTLFVLCQDEAAAKNLTDEDFGRGLGGDAIALAAEAFVEELVDFFPEARARTGLRKILAAGKQVQSRILDHAENLLTKLDPQAEAAAWIASRMNSPGSSALTPDPSPSANSS